MSSSVQSYTQHHHILLVHRTAHTALPPVSRCSTHLLRGYLHLHRGTTHLPLPAPEILHAIRKTVHKVSFERYIYPARASLLLLVHSQVFTHIFEKSSEKSLPHQQTIPVNTNYTSGKSALVFMLSPAPPNQTTEEEEKL